MLIEYLYRKSIGARGEIFTRTLWMLQQAKKGSQLSRWLRIACANDGK